MRVPRAVGKGRNQVLSTSLRSDGYTLYLICTQLLVIISISPDPSPIYNTSSQIALSHIGGLMMRSESFRMLKYIKPEPHDKVE